VVENDDGDEAAIRRTADRIADWLEAPLEASEARPFADVLSAGRGA
jgi:hypothetical protein